MHIRRGDKIGIEAPYVHADFYLKAIQRYTTTTAFKTKIIDVYLSTDDQVTIKEIEKR